MTDLDDVHHEAAPIGDVAAGHVGAHHAPVLLRRRLDGVDLGHPGQEIRAARHVAAGIDGPGARAQVVVHDDAAARLGAPRDVRAVEPLEIGADARRHDDHVRGDRSALSEGELALAPRLLDPRQRGPGPEGDAVLREPPRHDLRARGIHHPRQDARGDLDDGEGGAAGQDAHSGS